MSKVQFSPDNLVILLDQIKESVIKDEIPLDTQEEIWDTLLWDKNETHNKEMLSYLFTGWWINKFFHQ